LPTVIDKRGQREEIVFKREGRRCSFKGKEKFRRMYKYGKCLRRTNGCKAILKDKKRLLFKTRAGLFTVGG